MVQVNVLHKLCYIKLDIFNACNLINCFFSHREENGKLLKCGLEVHYPEQKEKLNQFYTIISNLKVVGKQSLMPWQHGVLTSITAILAIFEVLKETKGIRYILTSRFNQVIQGVSFNSILNGSKKNV